MRSIKLAKFTGTLKLTGIILLSVGICLFMAAVLKNANSATPLKARDLATVFGAISGGGLGVLCSGVALIVLSLSIRQVWKCRACGHETAKSGWPR